MNRAEYAFDYFVKQGWTPVQAAAIVGNLQQESGMGLNSGALNKDDGGPGNHSMGIGQWNRDRLSALQNFAGKQGKSWNDFDTQLAFVQHELNGPESSAAARLKAAGDIKSATAAFIGYERPQGWSLQNPTAGHGFGNRLNNAVALLNGNPNASAGPMDDPSIQAQNVGGFQFPHKNIMANLPQLPHMPNYDPMPGSFNVQNAGGPPPSEGILSKIFGSMGQPKEPYWMKGKGWDEEAKKAYLAQGLQDGGWPNLRSYLG
jgi:hypothetical protein